MSGSLSYQRGKCRTPGCPNRVGENGAGHLCPTCYKRALRERREAAGEVPECRVAGCGRLAVTRGLCGMHYKRERKRLADEARGPSVAAESKAEEECLSRMDDPLDRRPTSELWSRALASYCVFAARPVPERVLAVERSGWVLYDPPLGGWGRPFFLDVRDGLTADVARARVFATRTEAAARAVASGRLRICGAAAAKAGRAGTKC